MTITTTFSRRALGLGVAGLAAAAGLQQAVAQTAAMGGTWLDMVKSHHMMIAQTLDQILATNDGQVDDRKALLKKLAYLLTAHATAEENVLYPALARMGLTSASDQLYLEQAHAKVIVSDLEVTMKGNSEWLSKVAALKTAILHHAKDEEEADLFPKLLRTAGPGANEKMTADYAKEFDLIKRG